MKNKTTISRRWLAPLMLLLPLVAHATPDRLVILNWDDYLDADVVAQFERHYNTEVIQILYYSDEDRTERLSNSEARGYDLIVTSGIDLATYAKRGWLAPIDHEQLPNSEHIDPDLGTAFADAQDYGVPYFWGTLGIVYRSDLLHTPITSWKQLYQPAPDLQGRLSMLEDGRDLVSMGLKALGYSANSTDAAQMEQAESLLMAQKPHVSSYRYMSLEEDSDIVSGKIVASMAYSGDALAAMERNAALVYVVPSEGGNIWIDYIAVSARANNPAAAYQFLNYINEPETAARLARSLNYATTNIAASRLLPRTFLEHPVIYPDATQLANSEYYRPLPAKVQRKRNQIITRTLRQN